MVKPETVEVPMNKHILMTMLMISPVAVNAMDAPNGRSAYLPVSSTYMPLSDDQAFLMALAISEAEEQERVHKTEKDKQIEAKEMELALALSKQNTTAQPDQHDLTNPILVLAWAKRQGISMTHNEALRFADEQRDQLAIQQVIASFEPTEASKAPIKSDNAPQAPAKADSDSEEATADECFFCSEELKANVVKVGPNCEHKIHSKCLETIKTKYTECPVCNAKL